MQPILVDRPQAELIAAVYTAKNTDLAQNVVKLIDLLVQELRIDNDTAEGSSVLKNQGGIEALNDLKDKFDRGQPNMKK